MTDPSLLTFGLIIASLLMFAICFWSARTLIGWRGAWGFAALSLPLGWFAEQMGTSRGWFFGQYSYTDVLGPALGNVPLTIPLMWFALTWLAWLMACLILWHQPVPDKMAWPGRVLSALLAAMIVTAFDLGADPYFVHVLHAWIMQRTDGGWFGETLKGFAGWMEVSFVIVLAAQVLVKPKLVASRGQHQRLAVLAPLGIYAACMVFQMCLGHPVETRVVAFFAMGIPLLVALAAWWSWQPEVAAQPATPWPAPPLDAMTLQADPLADQTVAAIVGPQVVNGSLSATALARLDQASQYMQQWRYNGELSTWAPTNGQADSAVSAALRDYLAKGSVLPDWADAAKVARAEALFMAEGPLSCTLLFCASLPQCYVLPNLARVLQISGQLDAHTESRVRKTAAMVFPVMMKGGLMDPKGSGVAQVLKVRLVHATIRHLILRGEPALAKDTVPPGDAADRQTGMHQAMMTHGWDVAAAGLPCNQVDLAYTLLTFSYVFLKGMRTMGLGLQRKDEEAYLHTWNVMGHVLGVRPELMAHTMDEASALFEQMQAWGRAQPASPDVRPALGRALMGVMARTIRLPFVRQIPVPMTQWLIGSQASHDIGVNLHVPWLTRLLFDAGRFVTGLMDRIVRLFVPGFSLSRMLCRVIGYHMLSQFLLDQTRPIGLPDHLLTPLRATMAGWGEDARAPRWLNALEDRLTTQGPWTSAAVAASPPDGAPPPI